jgi:hypothetical protein
MTKPVLLLAPFPTLAQDRNEQEREREIEIKWVAEQIEMRVK